MLPLAAWEELTQDPSISTITSPRDSFQSSRISTFTFRKFIPESAAVLGATIMYTLKAGVGRWKKGEVAELLDASKAALEVLQTEASKAHSLEVELNSKPVTTVTNAMKLNIGGRNVDIHRTSLTQVPSRLAWMMNGRWDDCFPRDKAGRVFMDLDYEWIEPVFCYLRELAERECEPSDGEDPLCLVSSGSMGQAEVLRWLEMEFLLNGWTARSGETPSSSPPRKKTRLDEVMKVLERTASVVEDVKKDFAAEVEFMTDLKERLAHEDRKSLLHFNVGGTPFTVSKHTVAQAPTSKLWAQYCSGRWEVQDRELDQDGSIVLDMDPVCFGKIISCLRLAALAKDLGCDVYTWPRSGVVIEPSQRRCFDRMVAYLQIEETVFDGILERKEKGLLSETVRTFSKQLTEWVGTPRRAWKLLYRGSRDGFSAGAFHAACDEKGPTVVVVQDTKNSVFGGYSSVSWSSNGDFVDSPGAFLFSLSWKGVLDLTAAKKCSFIPQSQGRRGPSVLCMGNEGAIWRQGGTDEGCCFIIRDNCNTSKKSYAHLAQGCVERYGGDSYLSSGDGNFTVQEIEVYTCGGYGVLQA